MNVCLTIVKAMKWKETCFKDAAMPQQEKRVYSLLSCYCHLYKINNPIFSIKNLIGLVYKLGTCVFLFCSIFVENFVGQPTLIIYKKIKIDL